MKTFKVLQSNPNKKDGFVTKLQSITVVDDELFGKKEKKETLYISAPNQLQVGLEIPENKLFPKYYIAEHAMINPETKEEFMGKWLHCA